MTDNALTAGDIAFVDANYEVLFAVKSDGSVEAASLEAAEDVLLRPLVEGLGYVWWPGGNDPPADWDGGPVLCRDPSDYDRAGIWRRMSNTPQRDVLGYHRRVA